MSRLNISPNKFYCFIIALFAIFCISFKPVINQVKAIVLQDEKLNITPKEFYVADVIDERTDHNAIAWLINVKDNKTTPVDLQGGCLPAVKQFIAHNLPQNNKLLPIIIKIKKFAVTETALAGSRVQGRIILNTSFYLKRDSDLIYLADDNGQVIYNRDITQDTAL